MKSKTILFRDPVVERVCDKFVKRSDVGYAKYGRTLHDERTGKHKDLAGYLNDVQEELMDAILYIQAAKEELNDKWSTRMNEVEGLILPLLQNLAKDGDKREWIRWPNRTDILNSQIDKIKEVTRGDF